MGSVVSAGALIGDRYRLVSQIGRGGMGVVWRAEHLALKSPVAIKLITTPDDSRATDRFLNEARTAAKVRHRNIVAISDFGVTHDDQPYMVMELLEGETLAARLGRAEPLKVGEFLDLFDQTLAGLGFVHDAKLVHRDLKLENIFLLDDGEGLLVKLVDFGLTHHTEWDTEPIDQDRLTSPGEVLGTPAYMSPEQARRLPNVDARADVYSAGIILYEVLGGRLPFEGSSAIDMVVRAVKGERPAALETIRPELGAALSQVVERAMAPERADRYEDAKALRAALSSARGQAENVTLRLERARRTLHSNDPQEFYSGIITAVPPSGSKVNPLTGISVSEPEFVMVSDPSLPRDLGRTQRRLSLRAVAVVAVVIAGVVAAYVVAQRGSSLSPPNGHDLRAPARAGLGLDRQLAVVVELQRLPPGASVRVDGVVVEGPMIYLPRDRRSHRIEVVAVGYEPWHRNVVAERDAELTVDLRRSEPVLAEEPVARRRRAAPAASVVPDRVESRSQTIDSSSTGVPIFREPDF